MVILPNEANVVIMECIYIKKTYLFLRFLILIFNMGVCLFESRPPIWSFESTVRISTVRIVPTPLFKSVHTTLSTQILAVQQNCQPIRIVFVFTSQKSSGCICKSKWRPTYLNLGKQIAGKIFFFFNIQYTYVLS